MKAEPEKEDGNADNPVSIAGDVIGDTAYSERFVLKILLKLANRDTLIEEIKEQSFEEELCTLWDMTAERDVVLYLQTHDALNLFTFAMPVIDSSRLIEIVIGTIANMCCHKEIVNSIITNKDLLELLLDFLKSDDRQILNQLLRLINSCVYVADDDGICTWMNLFESVKYPDSLYFILKNSTNKELLMAALENLNTICAKCKIDRANDAFNSIFVTPDALAAVYAAHCEYRKRACPEDKLERLHVIALQITLHLTNIDLNQPVDEASIIMYDSSGVAVCLLRDILTSYESRIIEYYKIDLDFLDVLDAATLFIGYLNTSRVPYTCTPDKYFTPSYNMWKALIPNGREKKSEMLKQFMEDIKESLSLIMCTYMSQCTDEDLLKVLGDIGDDYGTIVSQVNDAELQAVIANRALNNRSRLNRDNS